MGGGGKKFISRESLANEVPKALMVDVSPCLQRPFTGPNVFPSFSELGAAPRWGTEPTDDGPNPAQSLQFDVISFITFQRFLTDALSCVIPAPCL
jgi:hypothetical protein